MADDLIDPLKAAQSGAADEGDDTSADAMFKEFSDARDKGLAPPEPEPSQDKADGGKQAAESDAGKAEDDGAAKAAPKTPETPEAGGDKPKADADDPKALRAALEAAAKQVETLTRDFHAYKSQEGRRLAALQGKTVPGVDVKPAVEGAAAPAAAPKKDEDDPLTSPEFLKVKQEYGDVIEPLEKVIKSLQGKLAAVESRTVVVEKDLSGLTANQANEYVAEQSAVLTEKHKDWQTIVTSPDFKAWLDEQPEEVQGLVKKNADRIVDARAGARALDFYKSDRGIGREPAKAAPKDEPAKGKTNGTGNGQPSTIPAKDPRRQRQLESAAAIPDKGPGPASGPTGDDDTALFRHYAAMKDKQLAANRI